MCMAAFCGDFSLVKDAGDDDGPEPEDEEEMSDE